MTTHDHTRNKLGLIISGSFIKGLMARLDTTVEDLRVGKFVVVRGEKHDFFSMITDVMLEATNQKVLIDPPDSDDFINEVIAGTSIYGSLEVKPYLMLPRANNETLQPVKTIPSHFSPLYEANEEDFELVFGKEDTNQFEIGRPLDMDVPVCINLERFVERSNGVFGKSGTGKSFLTRLLLCAIIKSSVASNLVFDMHGEYGWSATAETGGFVKGLRQIFGSTVLTYTLDPESAQGRNVRVDGEVIIGLNQIDVEDVMLLQSELNLSPAAAESSYLLADRYKERWLSNLLEMDSEQIREFADTNGGHQGSISALLRKLKQVERLGFVRKNADFSAVDRMIDALANKRHVVLDFGRHDNSLDYMLVANVITRRIHERWVRQTNVFQSSKNPADRPRQLMITIEEAHKFLNAANAEQTIFGKIAREMRKYSVTLLVVDQRPSSIDAEVLSQLGTRITALLNDDKDIDAVFSGVSGSSSLKSVLATLDSKQQAMVLGHAVPMAVVVRTRAYDEEFYRAMGDRMPDRTTDNKPDGAGTATTSYTSQAQQDIDELFF